MPDETHENTHLALVGEAGSVLVDCAGQPVLRLKRAGVDYETIGDVILTHFHPDHVYGVPMLLMEMWLRGRQSPLRIHGLSHCVDRMQLVMDAFEWSDWPKLFPISFHAVEAASGALLLENADFRITATPVQHFLPTMGLRVTDQHTGRSMAYSCDTEPCPAVLELAAGVSLLVHEAAGAGPGHTSAAQAGELARNAGAQRLALIHYPTAVAEPGRLLAEAQSAFGGPVTLTQDYMSLDW